jgi:hypothetical protein
LDNEERAANAHDPPNPPKPSRLTRAVENIKRCREHRRSERQKENPQDRAARKTAAATVWIAVFTFVTIGVGVSQFVIFWKQLSEMQSTGKQTDDLIRATKESADAAKNAAKAASDQNAITRAQIKASLNIPDEPNSTIRIGPDGTIAVDLYIFNTGQSWARDIYFTVAVIVRNGRGQIYGGGSPAYGAEFDVSPQSPWHHTVDFFDIKFPVSAVNNSDELDVSVRVAMDYTDLFDERVHRLFQLKAQRGDDKIKCCTIKELETPVELQRNLDPSRIPPIPAK